MQRQELTVAAHAANAVSIRCGYVAQSLAKDHSLLDCYGFYGGGDVSMKRVFHVEFMEGPLKASDFTVIAEDAIAAIATAKAILARRFREDPGSAEDPAKVWVSNVTLETEVEE